MLSRRSHQFIQTSRTQDYHHHVERCLSTSCLEDTRRARYETLRARNTPFLSAPAISIICNNQIRTITHSAATRYATPVSEVTSSQTGHASLAAFSDSVSRSRNVRDYLRQWSVQHQQTVSEGGSPGLPSHSYQASLPNSVFGSQDQRPSVEDAQEENVSEHVSGDIVGDEAHIGKNLRDLNPGDLFLLRTANIQDQYAIYIGHCEHQAQYLLADGRWHVDMKSVWDGYVFRRFATERELEDIKPFFPSRSLGNAPTVSDSPLLSGQSTGDIPLSASSKLLVKMKALSREVEVYKRQHAQVLTNIHNILAHESLFKIQSLNDILEQYFHVDPESAPEALKLTVIDHFSASYAMLPLVSRETYNISIMPKRFTRAVSTTTEWARQYQDAAARAAMGKDVSQELQKNPLTSFISKARRLITKSRKIRAPVSETFMSPTLPDARLSHPGIHRTSTGEEFDASDRLIIEFMWLTYVKLPRATVGTVAQQMSIGSLILRAVGAYPSQTLEIHTGQIFLAEIGCLDPWFDQSDHSVLSPIAMLGLNYDVVTAREKADKAFSQLKETWNGVDLPFPDTMASLRKDWGDLEVFAVDAARTVVVDDGFSVEASSEYPDCYWIHIHFSHLSAFLPIDHPFHNLFRVMGTSHYNPLGHEPALPPEIARYFSVGPDKPVLTSSTLLARDGSVKRVEMSAGVVHNVIKMTPYVINQKLGVNALAVHRLTLGESTKEGKKDMPTSMTDAANELWHRHESKLRLLEELLVARWGARYRESQDYVALPKIPRPMASIWVEADESVDRNHSRVYRSEHCIGDPRISIQTILKSLECTNEHQPERREMVTGAMLLAQESVGLWLRQHNVPAVYRYSATRANFDVEKLNSLGRHEGFIGLSGGDSTVPSPHHFLGTAQLSVVTNPLRRYVDLVNHYNIDAYLKAQAASPDQIVGDVQYPNSLTALNKRIRAHDTLRHSVQLTGKSNHHWMVQALLRAHTFGEAKLPKVWDFLVGNPLRITGKLDEEYVHGNLMALGIPVMLIASAKGWEWEAKFRQYLPVKLIEVQSPHYIMCEAVGPPSDNPVVNNGSAQHLEIMADDQERFVGVQSGT